MRRVAPGLALALLLASAVAAEAQELVIQARHDSRVWLEGTTSIGGFSCAATEARAVLQLDPRAARGGLPAGASMVTGAVVTVPVSALKCGNRRMEQDLYDAMRADSFPLITFALERARVGGDRAGADGLSVEGRLAFAGAQRALTTLVTAARDASGVAVARGRIPLRMTDYGVKPPVALFGLIRVRDEVTVRFDARLALPPAATLAESKSVVVLFRSAEHAGSAPPEVRAAGP